MDVARRNLLRGRRPQTSATPAPPWSAEDFFTRCTRCGDCVSACPSQIIQLGSGGFPTIDFSHGECTFCADCTTVCQSKALDLDRCTPWHLRASIDDRCLAQHGVDCRICGESCDAKAIHFELAIGKVAQPRIQTEQCTGCGACFASCPSQSIQIRECLV
ncbi:ferredoxin-type protein NapF [Deefgea sp. CFH1-16]|uniref:ferredoxin-type protein NapF n=1 Tax=Deefgea sp. CFH1-16 TaxID=2675457 RepID=UPI0015F45F29|nr:ferredoxin-type protein NapF [Deefgea sp. CFH1-16]MBM5574097.1 ferredoxin-type protein NapF [Deefgea sp. CFH1-16]